RDLDLGRRGTRGREPVPRRDHRARGRRDHDRRHRDDRRRARDRGASLGAVPVHEARPRDACGGGEPVRGAARRRARHVDALLRLGARCSTRRGRRDARGAERVPRPEPDGRAPHLRVRRRRARRDRLSDRGCRRGAHARRGAQPDRHVRRLRRGGPAAAGRPPRDPRRPAREADRDLRQDGGATRMRLRRSLVPVASFVVLAVVVAVVPSFVSEFRAQQLAYVGIYLTAIIGLNVLTGYTGQISLGHGAFMAVGGYTTAILMADHGVKDIWTIPLAGLVAGTAGFLFGIPALRLSGLYLALATFAIAVSMPAVLKRFEGFTGGGTGINLFGIPELTASLTPVEILGRQVAFNDWLYYLSWSIALVGYVVAWLLL